jgi:hypothetical protein
VAEIKDKEPNPDSESDYENTGKGQIIDADPTLLLKRGCCRKISLWIGRSPLRA